MKETIYRVRVRVQFEIDVDFEKPGIDSAAKLSGDTPENRLRFIVEDNGCPGTGSVGLAIEDMIRENENRHYCWACGDRNGENKILSIREVEVEKTAGGEVFLELTPVKDVSRDE